MIGCRNENGIDVLAIKHLPVIDIAVSPWHNTLCSCNALLVDIRDSQTADVIRLAALHEARQVTGSHITYTDDTEGNAVVRSQDLRRHETAHGNCTGRCRRALQELAP